MNKFTKEEISLCKQVAEKYRKDLKIGMYVWRKFDKTVQLIYRLDKEDEEIYTVILKGKKLNHLYWNNLKGGWLTPLWTISDCLEFLEKKKFYHIEMEASKTYAYILIKKQGELRRRIGGKTLLEACLKTVLTVLEEVKNG